MSKRMYDGTWPHRSRLFAGAALLSVGLLVFTAGCYYRAEFPVRPPLPTIEIPDDAPEVGLAPTRDLRGTEVVRRMLNDGTVVDEASAGPELPAYLHSGVEEVLRQQRLRVVEIGGTDAASFRGKVLSAAVRKAVWTTVFEVAFTVEVKDENGRIVFSRGYSATYTVGLFHWSLGAMVGDGLSGAIDAGIEALKADRRFLRSIRE